MPIPSTMRGSPGKALPSRKFLYVRKVQVGGETFLVGSDFFPATPLWMKG